MRALTSSGGKVEVVDKEVPSGEGELIAVTSSGICGSDIHLVQMGVSGVTLGHEFGGYTQDGRLVAVRPTGECGTCPSCRMRASSTCAEATSRAHGISMDGGLAEFVLVEQSRLFDIPDGTDETSIGLVEPLAVVIHGINRVGVQAGTRALVVGAGSIGLLAAAVLKDRGVNVDIVARHPHQFAAAEKLGVTALSEAGKNYDVSFDAVCTQQSFDQCVNATRPRGSLLEFGMVWAPVALSNLFMMKEINIIPSIYYSHDNEHHDFREAVDVLHRNPAITQAVVTHRFALDEADRAFDVASDRKSGAIKVHVFTSL